MARRPLSELMDSLKQQHNGYPSNYLEDTPDPKPVYASPEGRNRRNAPEPAPEPIINPVYAAPDILSQRRPAPASSDFSARFMRAPDLDEDAKS